MNTYRLARVLGIDIEIHITFFLLLGIFFMLMGFKGLVLILGVFFFVTLHEICHGLMAAYFGIKVNRITLLPIGGIASMSKTPAKPYQELLISVAGPLSNILVILIFYFPLLLLLGRETLLYPFMVMTAQAKYLGEFNILAHIYWINLVLAAFNLIPAFPMDGGRVLRALLSYRMSHRKATGIAVKMGHIFSLVFAFLGIANSHIFLIIIAVFIYMAASSEGMQTDIAETLKNYYVKDVLSNGFTYVSPGSPLSEVLEIIFRTHQEDFPVMEDGKMLGFITRKELLKGVHRGGRDLVIRDFMRTDIPSVNMAERLNSVRKVMRKYDTQALPVEKDGNIIGVVTVEDINRVYILLADEGKG